VPVSSRIAPPCTAAARPRDERGFILVVTMLVLLIASILAVATLTAADGDLAGSRVDVDAKIALAAAEAGINDYRAHLVLDDNYWSKCDDVPQPSAVSQAWPGTGPDARRWLAVPDSRAVYSIELIPANGASACNPASAAATLLDKTTGTFTIRSTGVVGTTRRTVIATFKRAGFLDWIYFTDYETLDPAWYATKAGGRATSPDIVGWASRSCVRYYRDGRGAQSYAGTFVPGGEPLTASCGEIRFVTGDVVAGPLHSNDELLICGTPRFGRTAAERAAAGDVPVDQVEVAAPAPGWRTTCGGSPTFAGNWTPDGPVLGLPASNGSLRRFAEPDYVFSGRTEIVLGGATLTVNGASMPFPPDGVIYVANAVCGQGYQPLDPYPAGGSTPPGCGDAWVRGTYSKDLTIATEGDIIINGDITHSGDSMLGLIPNNFARIYHPAVHSAPGSTSCTNSAGTMDDVRIDAAILALRDSFTVDNYYCGARLGTITVNGAIAQRFRGPVGTSGGSGYLKNYNYDDRYRIRNPPHFLDPVPGSWKIQRFTEQKPAR